MHPIRAFRNFKNFCLDFLAAIRALTEAIRNYDADIHEITTAVSYLARAEKNARQARGHKVDV